MKTLLTTIAALAVISTSAMARDIGGHSTPPAQPSLWDNYLEQSVDFAEDAIIFAEDAAADSGWYVNNLESYGVGAYQQQFVEVAVERLELIDEMWDGLVRWRMHNKVSVLGYDEYLNARDAVIANLETIKEYTGIDEAEGGYNSGSLKPMPTEPVFK